MVMANSRRRITDTAIIESKSFLVIRNYLAIFLGEQVPIYAIYLRVILWYRSNSYAPRRFFVSFLVCFRYEFF